MLAILRFVHLACFAFCLWRLALLEYLEAEWLQVTSSWVFLPEALLSFQWVRRALRAWATRQVLFANSAPGAEWEKIERDHEPLLQMLMRRGDAQGCPWLILMNFCKTIGTDKMGILPVSAPTLRLVLVHQDVAVVVCRLGPERGCVI